tara:strand:+ start:15812 stop:17152 length:1341 start_codon:yes stop_codon:yes gene_type:complete
MSNRYLEIPVSNKTSDGKMSFHNGVANLIFQLPAINSTLIPNSVRIQGSVKYYMDDAKTVASGVLTSDERLGVYSTFQSLTTRSIKHQQTIENIRHYGHFLANFLPNATSTDDAITHWSQSALQEPNFKLFQDSVVHNDATVGSEFCLPLPCGLFNGTQDIPLSQNMLGGLEIVLALASDSQALFSSTGKTDTIGTAWYEFDDLKIVCEVRDYQPDELSRLMKKSSSGFTYQTISSYYDTINSTSANVVFNLGLSKVRSVFASFIPSNFLNNYGENGYATLYPSNADGSIANVRKLMWTKGGALYPKQFEVNTNVRDSPNTVLVDPVVIKDYISAIADFSGNDSLQVGDVTTNRDVIFVNETDAGDPASSKNQVNYTKVPNGGYAYGLGIKYDSLGGSGIAFDNLGSQFGMNLDLDLTTNSPNSVFLFVNSEVNVVFNQNGLQVIQ